MYCLDLWPASLCAGGVKDSSIIYKVFHKLSAKIYHKADSILVTSNMFKDYLHDELMISKRKTHYLPQYAEQLFEPDKCTKIPNEWTDLMFAGNIGKIQNVEIIIKAAYALKDRKIRFHIVGDGTDVERLISLKKRQKLDNVIFHGRQPLEKMPEYYSMADAMLVTLDADPVLSLTLPGKVQTYMAAGKPIIGSINGETAEVIKKATCGFCAKANVEQDLINSIISFAESDNKMQMGKNAKNYYDRFFSKNRFIDRLESALIVNNKG